MIYDLASSTLMATENELDELVADIAAGDGLDRTAATAEMLETAQVLRADGTVHPDVVRLIGVLNAPLRIVALERLTNFGGELTSISWTEDGDVAIMRNAEDESASITWTHFTMLPGLLTQEMRLHPSANPEVPGRITVELAGDELETALAGGEVRRELEFLHETEYTWRVTGGFGEVGIDSSVVFTSTGSTGLWRVDSMGEDGLSLLLVPSSAEELLALVGDVVTGRAVGEKVESA